MLRVKKDDLNQKLSISFNCNIFNNADREINLFRPYDETIGKTFKKLSDRYVKHLDALIKDQRSLLEKRKLQEKNTSSDINKAISALTSKLNELEVEQDIQKELSLFDFHSNIIPLETKNIDAWQDGFVFKLKDQDFKVCLNLPSLKKIDLPKISIAGFPSVVRLEFESNETNSNILIQKSYFKWYSSELLSHSKADELKRAKNKRTYTNLISDIKWNLIDEGVSKRKLILNDATANRLIKVECFPRDSQNEGLHLETVSNDIVMEKMDLDKMPMTYRHKYTQTYIDSNYVRIMSYNILAACYTDSMLENEYEYCKYEYLNFDYRRPLLFHEITNYHCDVIFLQECDSDFVLKDLSACMADFKCLFMEKSSLTNEGEAILIRNDKLKYIKSFDISFAEKFNTFDELNFLKNSLDENQLLLIRDKGNVLQVALAEFIDMPGNFLLLANTHLYFHQSGDLVRLVQAIISVKYLQQLKRILLDDKFTKKVSIIFAGDFNSAPDSNTVKYILNGKIDMNCLNKEEHKIFENISSEIDHSARFISYDDKKCTNFGSEFEGILDYIFYEDEILEMTRAIPFPSIEKIRESIAIPNKYVPSDHLALIFEYFLKI